MLRLFPMVTVVSVAVCVGMGDAGAPSTTQVTSPVQQRLQVLCGDDDGAAKRTIQHLREEREEMLNGLLSILTAPQADRRRVARALEAMGALRAVEHLDQIVKRLDLKESDEHPYNRSFGEVVADQPAQWALVGMGPAVHAALLEAVADGRVTPTGTASVGYIIVAALGRELGKKRILDFAAGRPEEQRKRLLAREMMMYYD